MDSELIVSLIKNGGIIAALTIIYLIIKLFMNGKSKKDNSSDVQLAMPQYIDSIKKTLGRVEDLHKWHAPDNAGSQEWKSPRLAEAIDRLSKATTEQTKVMQSMGVLIERNTHKIDDIHKAIKK